MNWATSGLGDVPLVMPRNFPDLRMENGPKVIRPFSIAEVKGLPGLLLLFSDSMAVKGIGLVLGCLGVVFLTLHSYYEARAGDAMAKQWESKGCEVCRQSWLDGSAASLMPELADNKEKHSILRRCPECNTYWEEFERFADTISCEEVAAEYDLPG